MTIHYNKGSEKINRRKLRKDATPSEQILWEYLRNRKCLGIKFRRQYSIDQFVIDFFSPELKLALEVDGKIHLKKEVKNHDENRDGYLRTYGIKFIRLKNEMIIDDIEGSLELIKRKILEIKATSPKSSP